MKYEKEYISYLEKQITKDKQVMRHVRTLWKFNEWLIANQISDLIRLTMSEIMNYVDYLLSIDIKVSTINVRLNSIRKYYDCLIELGHITKNPALYVQIGRKLKKVVESPLDELILDKLYQSFETYLDERPQPTNIGAKHFELANQRYKLITSLMIYQGLDTGELDKLHVVDIDIRKGTIYVSGKDRRNSRVLKLETFQILPIIHYLQMLPSTQEKLFDIKVQKSMYYILKYLKGIEPLVKNAEHIRQSRIMIWVSTLNIREAQYNIGHRYVSSTEVYAQQNTKELVDEINSIHLFR
jgi:site-specific recombinase XerD